MQTLSRINRAHPQKRDCFVLDFQNNSATITFAFQDYYRTTLLAEETDPNKLYDLKTALDGAQVYSPEDVKKFVAWFLAVAIFTRIWTAIHTADAVYRNAKENTPHTARMAHDQALGKVMQVLLKDNTQVYKQFVENESFCRFVSDRVFAMTT